MMSTRELLKISFDMCEIMAKANYSDDMIEQATALIMVVPRERIPDTVLEFTRIAEKGLPEEEFHWEIGQVIKQIMGY